MDMDIVKRFIYGAKETYKKVDNHSFNFPITIESAYRLATNIERLLKEQEAVEPIIGSYGNKRCGVCRNKLQSIADKDIFCRKCGRKVKWDDNN